MNFYVMTLFPEMIENGMHTSITGRAITKGLLSLTTVNIRDYSETGNGRIDDYPYGGGAGMVMQAEPVYRAYEALKEKIGSSPRLVYLTPQGKVFHQEMAEEFAKEEDLVFLCGHYEGIDERVLEEIVTDCVSIGDYVLTGGELEEEFAELGGWEAESDASRILQGLGVGTEYHQSAMATLDPRLKVKVLLAQALFGNPDILLLDDHRVLHRIRRPAAGSQAALEGDRKSWFSGDGSL